MRTCTTCNTEMVEGFAIETTGENFCTAICLDAKYPNTSTELANMTDEELDESETYWTEWEDEDEDEEPEAPFHSFKYTTDELFPSAPTDKVKVEGHRGTWYTIATETFGLGGMLTPEPLYLMEHEAYGDEAPCVIINQKGELIMENVHNGFDDLRYCISEDIDPMTY